MNTPCPQYKCHTSHSSTYLPRVVYRVLCALGMIDKNDYRFEIRTPAALQSMLVLHASALSLSTTVYLTRNDLDRWMWSGLQSGGNFALVSCKNKIRSTTINHMVPLPTADLFAKPSRQGHVIKDDIQAYYGLEMTRREWVLSVSVPVFAVLQWAAKFDLDMYASVPGNIGEISEQYSGIYVEISTENRLALPWYASTGNSYKRIPRIYALPPNANPGFVPMSLDNWEV